MPEIIILHDFDGKLYFKALESKYKCIYLNSRPFRFLIRDLIKYKKITSETINSLIFLFTIPFCKDKTILIGMAPLNLRVAIYGWLCFKNKVILHSSWHEWDKKVPFDYGFFNKIIRPVWRYFILHCSKVIAVTSATKNSILDFVNNHSVDIVVIPHVVDIEIIKHEDLLEKWNNEKINVLFVGRLTPEKGINELISLSNEELLHLDNITISIVGKGDLAQQVINACTINPRLEYLGYISSRDELRKLFANNKFFLLPSKKIKGWEELFGLVIVEAMSQGCIVITTDHIGPREIVYNNVDGIITNEGNYSRTVVDTIESYLESNDEFIKMSIQAVSKSEKYNFDNISKLWVDAIKNINQ